MRDKNKSLAVAHPGRGPHHLARTHCFAPVLAIVFLLLGYVAAIVHALRRLYVKWRGCGDVVEYLKGLLILFRRQVVPSDRRARRHEEEQAPHLTAHVRYQIGDAVEIRAVAPRATGL